jgi:hypothetical protein
LFEFLREHDRVLCERGDHGAYGIEAQLFLNEELFTSRRFEDAGARGAVGRAQREAIEKGGA